MKTLPFYSQTVYFLYWKGYLQPCNRDLQSVIDWIKNNGGDLINYTVKSNICEGYNIHELIEGRLKANR